MRFRLTECQYPTCDEAIYVAESSDLLNMPKPLFVCFPCAMNIGRQLAAEGQRCAAVLIPTATRRTHTGEQN